MPESKKEVKIEKQDLKENVIDKDAIGDRAGDGSAMPMMASGSFMSQHSQSRMMSSGKPVAMNLMEKGRSVSSIKGAANYMTSPGNEPLEKGYMHSKKK